MSNVNSSPYTLETAESDDGTTHPTEHVWTPEGEDALKHGFRSHNEMLITGIGPETDDHLQPPTVFIALGHHPWMAVSEAATDYLENLHGTAGPGSNGTTRLLRAVHTHAVFIRHPHPDHPCGCEWDGTWRLAYAPPTEPGAVPVTALRHPAARPGDADLPFPGHGPVPATFAP
ncbi:hypothetical protein [Streptomyces mirabilis]|uniref:hypothetical protein n=1 Tax=Streptomyces mirabilis TaxID=68239 RepID=UPI0033E9559F